MDLGLADRVFVLTGSSRGLGFATAQCLVADGARVVLSSRDPDRVVAAAKELGEGAVGLVADLADPQTPQRLIDAATERFGRLDGALISVGGPPQGTAAQASDEEWREAFETIFLGTVRVARTAARALAAGTGGAIGLVLSTSARHPISRLGISNGLRPGLAGAAKDMADEYAKQGVRLFSLLPGRIMTDRNVELFAATGDPERARAAAEAVIPMGRLGQPEEFGRVAAFLLSPAASYLTGLTVPVDGGAVRTL